MNYRLFFMFLAVTLSLKLITAQHEDIPYEDVENICDRCVCLTAQEADKRYHHMLSCAAKHFKHILARWPEEFGKNHNGVDIVATFSNNAIELLQQLPATNATLTFSCRQCGIKHIQAPTFLDVPNIRRLDLSWNLLTSDELTAEVFRGPYRAMIYEPIALRELDLSHNLLNTLDRKVFEHTPYLTKLNISYNKLGKIDSRLEAALSSVTKLEVLDLSYTNISALPSSVFKTLTSLKVLHLAGNQLRKLPDELKLIGSRLQILNLAGNPITRFDKDSFKGLTELRRLNISDISTLKTITKDAFTELHQLEYLYCAHNPQLELLSLDNFKLATNLTYLDISYCGLTTLNITANMTPSVNQSMPRPWPKLRTVQLAGNPWQCDCDFLQIMEYTGADTLQLHNNELTRCEAPYMFSGTLLSNLNASTICSMHIPKQYRAVDEDPPRFLRKRYIILTLITASVVIVLGLIIGFVVSCIRRRLKRDDFGVEPIRYTSVRSSNLSAFSNPQSRNSA